MAHTSRCEKADGPDCGCSCGGLLHGGAGRGRWWRPVGNVAGSGMAPIPAPRGADVVQAGIEALHLVHARDRAALHKIHSAIVEVAGNPTPDSHSLCTRLLELARLDNADDTLRSTLARLSFASTFSPSPVAVLRVAALLSCPDPARHPNLERDCVQPLARQLSADIAVP
jgi:hypothetical protein